MQKNFTLKRIVCLLAALCLAAGAGGLRRYARQQQ